jgi:hypothetical protein
MGWASGLRNDVLNYLLRNTVGGMLPIGGGIKVGLHTGDPGNTGANQVAGGSYAQQTIAFNAAAAGAVESSADVNFTDMPAVTVTHGSIWKSDGTFMMGGALTTPKTTNAGDTFVLTAADVDVLLS